MDRKYYNRNLIDADIAQIIDDWHVCPYTDSVDDLFETFKVHTESYLKNGSLETKAIISIVKDLRAHLNPHRNKNMYYFTDIICDTVLQRFKGLTLENFSDFENYVQECLLQTYTRA